MTGHSLTMAALLLGFLTLFAICLILVMEVRRAEVIASRLAAIRAGRARMGRGRGREMRLAGVLRAVALLGSFLINRRLVPRKTLHEAELMLAGASLRGESVVAAFLGSKLLLLVALPMLGWVGAGALGFTTLKMAIAVGGAVLALVAPDMLLGRHRRKRLAALEAGLPDALDLLVICVDAGLAFEPALERVTQEIAPVHPEVAEEFGLTVNELRIAPDRRTVLLDMSARLDVEFLRRLSATLVQSMQIGAPLSRSLRMLAQELRQEQLVRFEARAGRLPVLLTLPMIVFIMPTVLLVVGGPALVQLMGLE